MPKSTSFHKGHTHFSYRVAAVIQQDGRILLHRSARDDFWSLPGGKVELGEEAEQALVREMREELGIGAIGIGTLESGTLESGMLESGVKVERLLWLVENFFEDKGEKHHELGLYFLVRLPDGDPRRALSVFEGAELHNDADPLPLYFQWFPCQPDSLAPLDIRPAFLREGLVQIPNQIQNIKIASINS